MSNLLAKLVLIVAIPTAIVVATAITVFNIDYDFKD
jgi:hypothetical protein